MAARREQMQATLEVLPAALVAESVQRRAPTVLKTSTPAAVPRGRPAVQPVPPGPDAHGLPYACVAPCFQGPRQFGAGSAPIVGQEHSMPRASVGSTPANVQAAAVASGVNAQVVHSKLHEWRSAHSRPAASLPAARRLAARSPAAEPPATGYLAAARPDASNPAAPPIPPGPDATGLPYPCIAAFRAPNPNFGPGSAPNLGQQSIAQQQQQEQP